MSLLDFFGGLLKGFEAPDIGNPAIGNEEFSLRQKFGLDLEPALVADLGLPAELTVVGSE